MPEDRAKPSQLMPNPVSPHEGSQTSRLTANHLPSTASPHGGSQTSRLAVTHSPSTASPHVGSRIPRLTVTNKPSTASPHEGSRNTSSSASASPSTASPHAGSISTSPKDIRNTASIEKMDIPITADLLDQRPLSLGKRVPKPINRLMFSHDADTVAHLSHRYLLLLLQSNHCFRLSAYKVISDKSNVAGKEAINMELRGIFQGDDPVLKPIFQEEITTEPTYGAMNVASKHDATGNLVKQRARYTAGGDKVAKLDPWETSSPTVQSDSVNLLLQQAQMTGRNIATIDVKTAYFNCKLNREVIIIIDKLMVDMILIMFPEFKIYVRRDGTMLAIAIKALYGLPECGKLWRDLISDILVSNTDLVASTMDPCLFYSDNMTIAMHVDDFLVSSTTAAQFEQLTQMLENKLTGITIDTGSTLSFLGMSIKHDKIRRIDL